TVLDLVEFAQGRLRHLAARMPKHDFWGGASRSARLELLPRRRRLVRRHTLTTCLRLQVLIARSENDRGLGMASPDVKDVGEDAVVVAPDVQPVLGVGLNVGRF